MAEHYSWEGEDVLVRKIALDILRIQTGFYVDIGAHHPFNLSNTALLYRDGWRGMNIDAMPGSMEEFRLHRPEDINIECAIGTDGVTERFYTFSNSILNGFIDECTVASHIKRGEVTTGYVDLKQRSICSLLDEHKVSEVDLVNIDIEGREYDVIYDWPRDRLPKMVVCEVLSPRSLRKALDIPIVGHIEALGYDVFSRLHFSFVFIRSGLC
jgi:FkbM family methyltransferase